MGRITIVSPSLKIGGIERALTVLANYFNETGYEVSFICCLKSKHFYLLNDNIKIIEPNFERTNSKLNKILFYPRLIFYLRNSIKKTNPEVILSYGDIFNSFVLLSTINLKIPVFISDRTSPDYKFKFPIPLLKKILYPRSKGFIAQTLRAKDFKEQQFKGKLNIRIIPNAIKEIKQYPEINRENCILFLGRFEWEKDPEILIRAFALISGKNNWNLLMAGSGPLLPKMKNLVSELDLEKRIIFLGDVEDIDKLFAKVKIFVLPSVLEGFPNALCEAMSAGLPSIAFHSIPYENIIEPGKNGIIVLERSADNLSKSIEELINNDNLRNYLGKNAKTNSEKFSHSSIGRFVLDFIFK